MANPKSAYSVPTKKEKSDTHIIVVWVDNEAGVLARVVGLFSGRGYNIESLAVAEVDAKKNISRITIVTTGTPQVIDQIEGDSTIWEQAPLNQLAQDGQLNAYFHRGFWRPMDTLRDKMYLNDLWDKSKAPWRIW